MMKKTGHNGTLEHFLRFGKPNYQATAPSAASASLTTQAGTGMSGQSVPTQGASSGTGAAATSEALASSELSSDMLDIHGLIVRDDLASVYHRLSKLMPMTGDVKLANDYWAFIEAMYIPVQSSKVFDPEYEALLQRSLAHFASLRNSLLSPESTMRRFPNYVYQWSLSDVLKTTSGGTGDLPVRVDSFVRVDSCSSASQADDRSTVGCSETASEEDPSETLDPSTDESKESEEAFIVKRKSPSGASSNSMSASDGAPAESSSASFHQRVLSTAKKLLPCGSTGIGLGCEQQGILDLGSSICAELVRLNQSNSQTLRVLKDSIEDLATSSDSLRSERKIMMSSLVDFAVSNIRALSRHQLLESIEEVLPYKVSAAGSSAALTDAAIFPGALTSVVTGDCWIVVTDDAVRVRAFRLGSEAEARSLVTLRDQTLGHIMETEYESFENLLLTEQRGVKYRCHVCRHPKELSELAACEGKLLNAYHGTRELRSACHRRFCKDCLLAYNWEHPRGLTVRTLDSVVDTSDQDSPKVQGNLGSVHGNLGSVQGNLSSVVSSVKASGGSAPVGNSSDQRSRQTRGQLKREESNESTDSKAKDTASARSKSEVKDEPDSESESSSDSDSSASSDDEGKSSYEAPPKRRRSAASSGSGSGNKARARDDSGTQSRSRKGTSRSGRRGRKTKQGASSKEELGAAETSIGREGESRRATEPRKPTNESAATVADQSDSKSRDAASSGQPKGPSAAWKCPCCLKLCICDRCTRNNSLQCNRLFVMQKGGLRAPAPLPHELVPGLTSIEANEFGSIFQHVSNSNFYDLASYIVNSTGYLRSLAPKKQFARGPQPSR